MIKSVICIRTRCWDTIRLEETCVDLRKKSSTSRHRMIDKMVRIFRRLCKILSRELRNAAKWRRGVRCRGGFAEMSLDCRLENTRDAVRDAGEMSGQGRLRRNQGRGYGRWNNPYPREPRVLTLLYISFSARDAARCLSQRSRRSREIEMLSEAILPRIKLMIDVDLIVIRNR